MGRIAELEQELGALRAFSASPVEPADGGSSARAAKDAGGAEECELLLCKAGDRAVALRLTEVREVVPVARLLPLPGSPAGVLGSLDLRGNPVVVHDLAEHLGRGPAPLERTNLILVALVKDGVVGIKVTEAVDVIRARLRTVASALERAQRSDVILGVSIHEGTQIMVVDVEAVAARSSVR